MIGQARPTTYKGIAMRSRLEAAYAHVLDSRSIEWVYEPQVFADDTGQYLPDFRLGGAQDTCLIFVETKPASLSPAEFIYAMRRMHIIRASIPNACLCIQIGTWSDGQYSSFRPLYMCDVYAKWAQCPICAPVRTWDELVTEESDEQRHVRLSGPASAREALGRRPRPPT